MSAAMCRGWSTILLENLEEEGRMESVGCAKNLREREVMWPLTLEEGQRPATDSVFADQLLPAFEQLQQDLWTCIGMRGEQQQQLAWYPGDGTGYSAHYDSWPVEEADSSIRKVTAILYCNPEWQPDHGGTLKAWLPDHVGARVLEVEPTAGRLVVFLSGIVKHEVSPAYQPRVAFTNWFI